MEAGGRGWEFYYIICVFMLIIPYLDFSFFQLRRIFQKGKESTIKTIEMKKEKAQQATAAALLMPATNDAYVLVLVIVVVIAAVTIVTTQCW